MLKKIILAALIAIPATMFGQKFGVIKTQELTQKMPEFKEVNTQLDTASKKYEEEFGKLQDEFQKKYDELQSLDEKTPQTIKDRRVKEMQELQAKIEQFRSTASQDLQKQQQQLLAPIEDKVRKAIESVGKEGGYTFIFEDMMPVYVGTDVVDITPIVSTRLGIKDTPAAK